MEPAEDLDDAVTNLTILYHNTPSITSYPVYLGDLDSILMPYLDGEDDARLDRLLARFWRFLDRTIPDAFTHANIGPLDSPVARSILRVDKALGQVVPNLTLKYDPDLSSDELLAAAAQAICAVNKPHIANHQMISADFPEGYGVVSYYNTLPLGGGSHTLVRLNLKESGARHRGDIDRYLDETLAEHVALTFEVIEARIRFLVEESGFYQHHFLVKEGLLHPTGSRRCSESTDWRRWSMASSRVALVRMGPRGQRPRRASHCPDSRARVRSRGPPLSR